ncbi:hypothetical protein [Fibrobacter sp. UWEL]|uniref:hypothetical protein n=1 Tax=Fibrobacter sp. UWEL TaxID=1896209 RepID=UPI00091B1F15|nr:hypothetical protein [Fibrobacter sp. UWEL]SHL06533.1 hypothetical protein SAMN05720468_11287 [Fibrobacter sp. UWEL]
MTSSALTKTAARLIKPVAYFMLTALTACGFNLAGTDEQENTVAANPSTDATPTTAQSSSSAENSDPVAVNPSTGNSGIILSSASAASLNDRNGTNLDSLILIICNDQTFYIVPSENSTIPSAGQPDNPSEPAVTPPSSSSASKGDFDSMADTSYTVIVNGETGDISYNSQKEFGSVTCNQGGLTFSYSIKTLEEIVIKSFFDYEMTDTESFKNDCEAEGGRYELISEGNLQCTINVQGQAQYKDPVWEKYSQAVIGHCRN